ncbi:MAG: hypothetical protein CVT48_00265 [Thermoplasmata archaeon HGW-Thermoplasmata-1]|nr:MAG: hypothetical protein CVT48_00265 [Thermoplasmata archaeon HGW-Thermoplasmata-1]
MHEASDHARFVWPLAMLFAMHCESARQAGQAFRKQFISSRPLLNPKIRMLVADFAVSAFTQRTVFA